MSGCVCVRQLCLAQDGPYQKRAVCPTCRRVACRDHIHLHQDLLSTGDFVALGKEVRGAAQEASQRRPKTSTKLVELFKLDAEIRHLEHCEQLPCLKDPMQSALFAADKDLQPLHDAMAALRVCDLPKKRDRCLTDSASLHSHGPYVAGERSLQKSWAWMSIQVTK